MQLYTLGPLNDPDLVITDTSGSGVHGRSRPDPDGVQWMCDYPKGWDDVDNLLPVDNPAGVDGGLVGPQSVGVRVVELAGMFIAPSRAAAKAATRRLRAAASPRRGPVVFAVTDEDGQRQWVTGYPTGRFHAEPAGGRAGIFSFALTCTDPHKRGDLTRQATAVLPNPSAQTGVTFPRATPLVFAAAAPTGGTVDLPHLGDADAHPISTWTGPAQQPSGTLTDGSHLVWDITLAAGDVLVADHRTGLTAVNGIDRYVPQIGGASALWSIPPGGTRVEFRQIGAYDPAASARFDWHDTYR